MQACLQFLSECSRTSETKFLKLSLRDDCKTIRKMTNNVIHDKSKAFAIRIIRFVRYLQTEKKDFILSNQTLRSGTSIGANIRESRNAQSSADFINKLSIALKEADETAYWLELLFESDTIDQAMFNSLYNDNKELIALLTSIIKTTKNNN